MAKKLERQFAFAVEWRVRDRIIQASATENAATIASVCKLMYLLKRMDFSYSQN